MGEDRWLTDKYWVTPYNFIPEVRDQLDIPAEVQIHDVTLREAEQAPHIALKPDEKIRLARALDDLGVARIEIFPIVSDDDREVARELARMGLRAKVIALARWLEEDIDVALECGVDGVMIEGPCNPWFTQACWGMSADQMIESFTRAVAYAKRNGLYTVAVPWDAWKAPLEVLERLYKSMAEYGPDALAISDTFGFSLPWTTVWMIRKLRSWVPGIPVEMHAHNDFGLATVDMLAAVAGGATCVHTSLNALGERAGNAATEEVALALELLMGCRTGIRLEKLYPVCQLAQELAKVRNAPNKPVVGDNEFTYESGLVVFMLEKLADAGRVYTMMPFSPQLIGRDGYQVILGKMSGSTSVELKLKQLGIRASPEQVEEITRRVKREAITRKWSLPDYVFRAIVREVTGEEEE